MTAPLTGRLIITGGSNSVMREGWTAHLDLPEGWQVENLSIGAASTLMALYRLLAAAPLRAGDVVVWEYALNEYNHWRAGFSLAVLADQLHWLMGMCRDAGARLQPVIMYTQQQHEDGGQDDYVIALRALLAEAGLDPICCNDVLAASGGATGSAGLYSDPAHYRVDHPILTTLAAQVARRVVAGPAVPALDPPSQRGRRVWLVDSFADMSSARFANSRIACTEYPLRAPHAIALTGRLLGVIVIAAPNGGGLTLTTGGGQSCGPFATSITADLPGPRDGRGLPTAGRLILRPWNGLLVQPTFDLPQGPRDDALVALIMASPTAPAPPHATRLHRLARRVVDRLRRRP